jgi:Domain of unknown function (DUF4399)
MSVKRYKINKRIAAFFITIALSSISGFAQNAFPPHAVPPASFTPEVYFVNLKNGDSLRSPFRVIFGLSQLGIAPAGIDKKATGHHHLLVNTPLPRDLAKSIPFSDQYRHFGAGQTEAVITLPPGKHTLQLLFADYEHKPFVKAASGASIVVFSKQITIEIVP